LLTWQWLSGEEFLTKEAVACFDPSIVLTLDFAFDDGSAQAVCHELRHPWTGKLMFGECRHHVRPA
jgi:hypothetical protein